MDRGTRRREATTREKVVQVILGLLIYALFTAIALGVLVVLVKVHHLGT
jgi:hypothetical protein